MKTITERIFGKPIEDIDTNDLNIIINKTESLELEFKQIDGRLSKNEKLEKIFQPLVSFLNSSKGSGLLILGVKEGKRDVAEKIVGVNPKILSQLQTEGSLETSINAQIRSIPSEIKRFELKVRSIPWSNEKNVYLVEIYRNDPYCVYSSDYSGRVYVREGRKSPGLNLNDAIELVYKKNYARLYMDVNFMNGHENQGKENSIFGFKFINKGTKPARDVFIVFIFCSNVEMDIGQRLDRGFSVKNLDLEKFDLSEIETYNFIKAFSLIHKGRHPASMLPIYPLREFSAGNISFNYKDCLDLRVYTLIFEENGFTKQEFQISKKIKKSSSIEEDLEKRIFKPYLTL